MSLWMRSSFLRSNYFPAVPGGARRSSGRARISKSLYATERSRQTFTGRCRRLGTSGGIRELSRGEGARGRRRGYGGRGGHDPPRTAEPYGTPAPLPRAPPPAPVPGLPRRQGAPAPLPLHGQPSSASPFAGRSGAPGDAPCSPPTAYVSKAPAPTPARTAGALPDPGLLAADQPLSVPRCPVRGRTPLCPLPLCGALLAAGALSPASLCPSKRFLHGKLALKFNAAARSSSPCPAGSPGP